MNIYIYIYTYIHTYIHTYLHKYTVYIYIYTPIIYPIIKINLYIGVCLSPGFTTYFFLRFPGEQISRSPGCEAQGKEGGYQLVVQYFAENRHLDAPMRWIGIQIIQGWAIFHMLNYLRRFFEFCGRYFWLDLVGTINKHILFLARHQEKDKSWTLQILCVEDSWETNSLLWKITILIGKSTINGPFFAYLTG